MSLALLTRCEGRAHTVLRVETRFFMIYTRIMMCAHYCISLNVRPFDHKTYYFGYLKEPCQTHEISHVITALKFLSFYS